MPLVRPGTVYWTATSSTTPATSWQYWDVNTAFTTTSTTDATTWPVLTVASATRELLWRNFSVPPDKWRIARTAAIWAQQQAAENLQEAVERANRNKVAAARRARELLLSFLDDAQRAEFRETRSITVLGRHALYRIEHGRIANISVLGPGGRELRRLCVHPEDEEVPIEDVMLSQLLHLRSDEDRLLQQAKVHPARRVA